MEAIRGCALGRRSARDPGVRQIRVARASERTARGAFAARRAHERAAAHGMGGEAAGHARAKANTRRIARGVGRGEGAQPRNSLRSRSSAIGCFVRVTVHTEFLFLQKKKERRAKTKEVDGRGRPQTGGGVRSVGAQTEGGWVGRVGSRVTHTAHRRSPQL